MPRANVAFAALLLLAITVLPAKAQIVYPGDTRVEMSDVTGPPITSGDLLAGLFGPGTARSFSCPVAWGVRTEAERTAARLRGGNLPIVAPRWAEGELSDAVRRDLLLVLTDASGDDDAARRLVAALSERSGSEASEAARGLVERLDGLLANAVRLRPSRPGYRTATQLASAVGAYNTFVGHSSAEFLRSPPEALLGIQAALSPLLIGALENEGREASRAVDGGSLACARPVPETVSPSPVTPPLERAVVVCVVAGDGIRAVGAIVLESGDTVVVSAGQRVPLSTVFPDPITYAGDQTWYVDDDDLTLNGRRYVRFGLPALAAPDANLRRVGEHLGVPLFAEAGEDHAIVPVRPGCLMQEYRPEGDLRVRG